MNPRVAWVIDFKIVVVMDDFESNDINNIW